MAMTAAEEIQEIVAGLDKGQSIGLFQLALRVTKRFTEQQYLDARQALTKAGVIKVENGRVWKNE